MLTLERRRNDKTGVKGLGWEGRLHNGWWLAWGVLTAAGGYAVGSVRARRDGTTFSVVRIDAPAGADREAAA